MTDADDVFEIPVDPNCVTSITEAIHQHFDLATARQIIRDFKATAGLRPDQDIPTSQASAFYGAYSGALTDCACPRCVM